MVRRILLSLLLGAVIAATGPLPGGIAAARAQDCYSAAEARSAWQSGEVKPLSSLLGRIRAAAHGEIVSSPQLCNVGGRMVYIVHVLTSRGETKTLTVDAQSGTILSEY